MKINWLDDGWSTIQEADPEKHILEIAIRAEAGVVVEAKIRHSRGEEQKGNVTLDGANALPMPIKDFQKLFKKGKFEFR